MTLRIKLLLAFMLASIVPLMCMAYLLEEKMKDTLISDTIDSLTSTRDLRGEHIHQYMETIHGQIESMSDDQSVSNAMKLFAKTFDELDRGPENAAQGKSSEDGAGSASASDLKMHQSRVASYYNNEFKQKLREHEQSDNLVDSLIPTSRASVLLQSHYIAQNTFPLGSKNSMDFANDGSSYSDHHRVYHSYFNNFLNRFGYYDIFLVDPDSGHVVYSVYKEVDYATSLKSGPFAKSGLGRAFDAAISAGVSGESTLIEFDHYFPSYNQPASFISKAIVDGGRVIGVLIFQVPLDRINASVTSPWGLGETGKAYMVGSDNLLRTQARFVDDETVLAMEVDYSELKQRGDGKAGKLYTDYRGHEVLSVSKVIDVLGLEWLMVVERDAAEVFRSHNEMIRIILVILTLSCVFAIIVSVFMTRDTQKKLGADPETLSDIAKEIASGDLSRDFGNMKSLSGTLKVIVTMQSQLRDRLEKDQQNMTRIYRLRNGLQMLSTMVCLSAEDHNIAFANTSMRNYIDANRSDMSTLHPGIGTSDLNGMDISLLSDNPRALRAIVENLETSHEFEIYAGCRVILAKVNAIWDTQGTRLGTTMEWTDVTDERRVMDEVDSVVRAANAGDLGVRIDTLNKDGIYLALAGGVNGLLDVTSQFVEDVEKFLSAIAEGDLSETINSNYDGSFADVKRDANKSVTKLTEIMQNIRTVARTVDTASREINAGNINLSQRTERAASSLQETSSSMEEMTETVKQNASNSRQAKELALSARAQAEKGGAVVGEAVEAMEGINESSRKISDIIGVIDDIAFQTNLLALNASVEAARAGEQGRGFAVVASEVRILAGRSATAAKEIKELIEDSVIRVENGAQLVNESGRTLGDIVAHVKGVTDIVAEISEASQEQSDGITMVNQAIAQLDEATQQNAALVEQASAASQSTIEQVEGLIRLIGFFKTGESSGVSGENTLPRPALSNETDTGVELGKEPMNAERFARQSKSVIVVNSNTDLDWEEC